ncbi:MAG: T9SS type A sorting domain-containing protein [Candidatus Hatepunaea meridiana]|nr:T9SS type A sorting domain-containing protein [Candidatus Hatepunaea meridiana]
MKPAVRFILVFLIILTTSSVIDARIINVPEDQRTIQEGISRAQNGDTVLVQPGVYRERIIFSNISSVTLGSLLLTTGNPAYIDSTIIEAAGDLSVIYFRDREDNEDTVIGFTVRGGNASYGGGIYINNAGPTLSDLKIYNNEASGRGGGIYCTNNANPIIRRTAIFDNTANHGGGIGTKRLCNLVIERTLITHNNARVSGGGVHTEGSTEIEMTNVTISENEASQRGHCFYLLSTSLSIVNSIFWGHDNEEIIGGGGDITIEISYTDFEEGREGINYQGAELIWGDGNIDEDPLFEDADEGDFHLHPNSPCIDAGDTESDNDPDGTRADMGALPFLQGETLQGYVYDAADDSPLEGALVTSTFGIDATTNEEGFWRFIRTHASDFDLTISMEGYNDSTLTDLEFGDEDTLEIIVSLLHPEFSVSPDEISEYLLPNRSTETTITISNHGNGPLTWTIKSGSRGVADADPWTLRESIFVGGIANDSRIEGVIFADDHYYVSGANRRGREDGPNMIWVLNREGELVDNYEQCGNSNYGFRDLAWDGELIWGSGERNIYAFTTDGEVVDTIYGSFSTHQALAWDSDRNILWASGITSQYIAGFDREGNEIDRIPRSGLRTYGLAYWGDDPDGYPLYVFHSPYNGRQVVHKIRLDGDNSDTMFVAELTPEDDGTPNGAFITRQYDISSWVMMSIANNGSDDRIDVWCLTNEVSWLQLGTDEGTTNAGDDRNIIINVNAVDLEADDYEGEILIQHNAAGESFTIDVTLRVRPYKVDYEKLLTPSEFCISNIYPNPFNSTTKLTYTIPQPANVTLRLFDVLGREVTTLVNEQHKAGRYTAVISGEQLTTGVYIARLEANGVVSLKKLVVVK